jgi:hypothetical protein
MGRCWTLLFGLLGATTMGVLTLSAQHSAKGRFTGDVNSLIGKRRDDACRRSISKAGLIGYAQYPGAFFERERMRWRWPYRHGPAIAGLQSNRIRLPSMQRSPVNPAHLTGFAQTGASALRSTDILDQSLAIFQSDHSSSPRWSRLKIASTFFESTKSAAA